MKSSSEKINTTEVQIAAAIKDLAKQEGEMPLLKTVQLRTAEIRGRDISTGGLYHVFSQYGKGGISDFARAHGVHPAVIVDGEVYSTYLHPADSDEEKLTGFSLHSESPLLEPTTETAANALRELPTPHLIGLLGDIAIILQQRSDQTA